MSKKTFKKKMKRSLKKQKKIFIGLIIVALLFGLAFGAYSFFADKTNQSDQVQDISGDTANLVKETLGVKDQSQTVKSSLGFAISYDTGLFDASGQVTDPASDSNGYVFGTTYQNEELAESRDYSIVKIKAKETEDDKKRALPVYYPELTVLTNIRKSYWDTRANQPQNIGKTKLQILIDETTAKKQESNDSELTISEPENIEINGNEFSKVTYTQTNRSYGVDVNYVDVYYFAVNNDRPYYISIVNVQRDPGGMVNTYESFIESFTFEDVDQTKLSVLNQASNVLGANTAAAEDLPEGTSKTISKLDDKTILNVVAKNQIAVVRIGSVNCMDVSLNVPGDSTAYDLDDVCIAAIGSGSIVSGDGYIATNGHVVQTNSKTIVSMALPMSYSNEMMNARFGQIGKYLIKKGKISIAQINALLDAAQAGNKEAEDALYNLGKLVDSDDIKIKSETNKYAVQLSNDPLRVDMTDSGIEPKYTDTVVSAEFVDSNFDPNINMMEKIDVAKLETSDVAILKMEKSNYPSVALGSITDIKSGSQLTAIGFPGFVDGGLTTTETRTVPSVTQGKVRDIYDQSNYKLITTNVPIAQGNSGGPAFDDFGFQIGLNTYSNILCADRKCFGDGTARDIEDYRNLLKTNSIQLQTKSSVSDDWNEAVSALSKGKYKVSTAKFESVAKSYKNNYLATEMAKLSSSLIGSPGDTSSEFSLPIPAGALVVLPVILIAVAGGGVVFVVIKRKRHMTMAMPNQAPQTYNSNPQAQASSYQPQTVSQPLNNPQVYSQNTQPVQSQVNPAIYQQPAQPVSTETVQASTPMSVVQPQPVQPTASSQTQSTQAQVANAPQTIQPNTYDQPAQPQAQVIQPTIQGQENNQPK